MNILRMMAEGASIISDSYVNPRVYDKNVQNGFRKDNIKLRGDVYAVGGDMKKAISNGKSHASQGK